MNQGPVVHQRWLQAIKEFNDTSAYEELYRYCWKDLYQHAARRILDRQDVEDILQELFVQFWERRHTIDIQMNLQAYLKGMLKYKIIDFFNSNKAKDRLLEHWSKHIFDYVQQHPEDLNTYLALEKLLEEELEIMPQNMRQALLLKWEHLSIREIAMRMGLSEQTVKNNLTEASKRLRKAILGYQHVQNGSFSLLLVFMIDELTK
ncbi:MULTISPECIES: RNA polymerase sigma factor [unclassified Sphingobacterium]|uniref:RNA polymerase sigma factor n=1 Tax=unclassified Sphingobacterium TaxID=2609468 RepID=UPI0029538E14|nr:sigma-70 family RNA polymerase sigma factor [Sphingobacterium sp. UGAL515B_05]WON94875.1 sigma-70 family RNA polymerase sigma factor [Sphingobacterium sp. UGAL515B_05]